MIGNDIIDLRDPDADFATYSPRFDERVFGPFERHAIEADGDPEACRWRTFAAKEAAYKALRKIDSQATFSPRRLEVAIQSGDPLRALVIDRGTPKSRGTFEVRFFVDESCVHAIALHSEWDASRLVYGSRRTEAIALGGPGADVPGQAARLLACEKIAEAMGIAEKELEIRKRDRIPFLLAGGVPVSGNLSLSHHGAFVGFAFEWEFAEATA
jgi:hypothetical protein